MNQSEELFLKLQKVKLAIAEVKESNFDTEKQKRIKLTALERIEKAILLKGQQLHINLNAA